MSVEFVNPDGLAKPEAFRQVAVATGSRIVFIAGQVAWNGRGELVGAGDLAAQTDQAVRNVATALSGVGGSFADVTRLVFYVAGWAPEKMAELREGRARAAASSGLDFLRPITVIGVTALAAPEYLVEIDATAVLH